MAKDTAVAYSPAEVEAKWQARWEEAGTNAFTLEELSSAARPYYNLMMFPYPSAEGLHVGNIYAFTGADVHGRYRRLLGLDVFEPIGFDAFGIHSENFALKQGVHPMDLIPSNVANFTRQLRRIGGMFDWRHTVDTTSPEYYRWTQWIFLKLLEAGLAERKEAPVNWCPSCMTVLANEQVIAGLCERCETPVEQRRIAQWFFRISEFSERLLDNLERIDWSETTKKAQANWIGRSEGAELHFPVVPGIDAPEAEREAAGGAAGGADGVPVVSVFTTRPDTVFGATYMVLAPEHPLVEHITTAERREEVEAYRQRATRMDVVARRKADKGKTGVFTGAYCRNPANDEPIPVWIADYVLMEYGTGAIMAVPGHDERDFEFARQFDLPIRRVVSSAAPDGGSGAEAEAAGAPSGSARTPGRAVDADAPAPTSAAPAAPAAPMDGAYAGAGVLVNSGAFNGMEVEEGGRAITEWLAEKGRAEKRVNFRLHDWCISRQRYWGPPIPIVHCDACGAVPVPESELPVILPRVEDFKPDDTGVSPLARVSEWYETACPACDGPARRETDVSDTFLDSSWYFLRYPSTDFDDRAFDGEITRRWLPVDCYIGGNEHAVLHLLYARFITMALHDMGLVDFEEPFIRFRAHGLIIREGAKMSKSRGNVIVPDPIIERYGADTFRVYLMFLGPFEEGGDYRDEGIHGPHGFLNRLWDTVVSVTEAGAEEGAGGIEGAEGAERGEEGAERGEKGGGARAARGPDGPPDPEVERKLHRTIEQVGRQLADLQYNTAIAAMMEYLNAVRAGGRSTVRAEVEPLVPLVAPFAPHLAEELWARLGHREGLFEGRNWPDFDPAKTEEEQVRIAVQVNGKLRGTVEAERGLSEERALELARGDENVVRHLDGATVRRVVWVPDRLLNIVAG